MKRAQRPPKAPAPLSDRLLAYAAATAATLGAVSNAPAIPPPVGIPLDAEYFGGTLPQLSFGLHDSGYNYETFAVGSQGAQFVFGGAHAYYSGSSFRGYLAVFGGTDILSAKLNGVTLSNPNAWVLSTESGGIDLNAFGSGSHYANFSFATNAGGYGVLRLNLQYDGNGAMSLSVAESGSYFTAVPEPVSVAAGLGLIALGYTGIREHRRRRALAKPAAASS